MEWTEHVLPFSVEWLNMFVCWLVFVVVYAIDKFADLFVNITN